MYDMGPTTPRINNLEEGLKYGKTLSLMVNGSYYAYIVNPGTYYLLMKFQGCGVKPQTEGTLLGDDYVSVVNVAAGKRYFLLSTAVPFMNPLQCMGRASIERRTVAQGEDEIDGCHQVVDKK